METDGALPFAIARRMPKSGAFTDSYLGIERDQPMSVFGVRADIAIGGQGSSRFGGRLKAAARAGSNAKIALFASMHWPQRAPYRAAFVGRDPTQLGNVFHHNL